MLFSITASNYLVYSNKIEMSLRANNVNTNTVSLCKLSVLNALEIYWN